MIGFSGSDVVLALLEQPDDPRRTFSRAPLSLPVRVRPRAGGDEWSTTTRDHEVVAAAVAVRVTDAELALRFDEIDRDDCLLVASRALAYHRRG